MHDFCEPVIELAVALHDAVSIETAELRMNMRRDSSRVLGISDMFLGIKAV